MKKEITKNEKPKTSGCFIAIIIMFVATIVFWGFNDESFTSDGTSSEVSDVMAEKIIPQLQFLNDIEEVEWWHVDSNNIYIAFSTLYPDYQVTCNAAAYKGNKAADFGCHVFAVSPRTYPSYEDIKDDVFCENYYMVTYRYGKIED